MKIYPVIMSGGSGTRLWPLSTAEKPKQFHALLGETSMIVETARRFEGRHGELEFLAPIFIAGERHKGLLEAQLADAGMEPAAVVLEPMGRNTAATAALAALVARELDPEAKVLLMPADHLVGDCDAFIAAISAAAGQVGDRIVTFGMAPNGPETGFGYIHQGAELGAGVFEIAAFKEKPGRALAESYLAQGGYSWNSGVFFFSPELMLGEFEAMKPDLLAGARGALEGGRRAGVSVVLDAATFAAVESLPIDIAIMEKTKRGAIAPCSIGWADIGSWAEYWRLSDKDGAGNVAEGSVLLKDTTNLLVRSEDGVQVSVAGVSDLIIVATKDAVLVLPRDQAQGVKDLIPKVR